MAGSPGPMTLPWSPLSAGFPRGKYRLGASRPPSRKPLHPRPLRLAESSGGWLAPSGGPSPLVLLAFCTKGKTGPQVCSSMFPFLQSDIFGPLSVGHCPGKSVLSIADIWLNHKPLETK